MRPDTYVYLAEEESFNVLPEALRDHLGDLELALEFELTPTRRLVRADAKFVIEALVSQGFYLHLPPGQDKFL